MSWEVANYIINKTKENIDELSSKEVKSTDPYTYRQSKGNLADMEIVGASVGWNQLVQNGNFESTSGWNTQNGSLSVSNNNALVTCTTDNKRVVLEQTIRPILNHKYLVSCKIKFSENSSTKKYNIGFYDNFNASTNASTSEQKLQFVFKTNSNDASYGKVWFSVTNAALNDTLTVSECNVIDLTLLFGSTIADAIYAMEQATAGAGGAFFRKYFPEDYYAYDAGSIQSVCIASRKVVGKNLIESKISGVTIGTEGKIKTSSGYSVSIAKVIEGETYIVSTDDSRGFVGAFFKDLPVLGSISYNDTRSVIANKVFTAPISGYVAFLTYDGYAFSQCEFGTTATPYEPYTETAYSFDSTKELRGLFSLVGGELKASGDIYTADGNIQRKYGIVDLGTLTWSYEDTNARFIATLTGLKLASVRTLDFVCAKYVTTHSSLSNVPDKSVYNGNQNALIIIHDSAYTDAATFKTAMSGVYLVYELATPTTKSAQPYQNPQRAYIDGTEEFTDGLTRDVMIPVGNNTTYQQDKILPSVEDYVDSITDTKADISSIATEENGTIASQAYSVGQHFYKDGKFCTAIASIAIGSSFTLDTNYVKGTIAEAIEGKKAVLDIDPSAATISAYEVGTMWLKTQ